MKILIAIVIFILLKIYELTINPIVISVKWCIKVENWRNTPDTSFIELIINHLHVMNIVKSILYAILITILTIIYIGISLIYIVVSIYLVCIIIYQPVPLLTILSAITRNNPLPHNSVLFIISTMTVTLLLAISTGILMTKSGRRMLFTFIADNWAKSLRVADKMLNNNIKGINK